MKLLIKKIVSKKLPQNSVIIHLLVLHEALQIGFNSAGIDTGESDRFPIREKL